jgi:hypothetical protein
MVWLSKIVPCKKKQALHCSKQVKLPEAYTRYDILSSGIRGLPPHP